MRLTHTYSRHWDIETRQHELLGIDLGEGIPRKTLRYALAICGTWWALWLLVFGFPPARAVSLFLAPPIALTWAGSKRSQTYWRRTNLLVWSVRIAYLMRGIQPVLGRGRIPGPRLGVRLRARRLGERVPQLPGMPGLEGLFGSEGPDPTHADGEPVSTRPRVRLYGPDAVAKSRRKRRRSTTLPTEET